MLLNGAQTVPRQAVDVRALDVDFLAFSPHKMCGPRRASSTQKGNSWDEGPKNRKQGTTSSNRRS